jgi:PhzF family phenazine biosynthesis protein
MTFLPFFPVRTEFYPCGYNISKFLDKLKETKMKIPLYQVDAFTSKVFSGNPAAVCLLESWPEDRLLQAVAAENNLSETAFLLPKGDIVELRWFTPVIEVTLCGHATLASAFVLFHLRGWPRPEIKFQTRKSSALTVTRSGPLLVMNFPARPPHPIEMPSWLEGALGARVEKAFGSTEDLLAVLRDESTVRQLKPDMAAIMKSGDRGIIVTARGTRSDFVSRFFAPQVGIPEDPVTGSAHCVLTPYWADVLGKHELHAYQVSARGGELFCREKGPRVEIAGGAALYLEGTIDV